MTTQPAAGDLLVEMEGISKTFPGVHALDGARFDLRAGEVHALVGENGAGKSTLMKVLAGIYRRDAGDDSGPRRGGRHPDAGAPLSTSASAWSTRNST